VVDKVSVVGHVVGLGSVGKTHVVILMKKDLLLVVDCKKIKLSKILFCRIMRNQSKGLKHLGVLAKPFDKKRKIIGRKTTYYFECYLEWKFYFGCTG